MDLKALSGEGFEWTYEGAAPAQLALALLSEPHRMVFELGVLQELPYAEISDMLDIPIGTVKSSAAVQPFMSIASCIMRPSKYSTDASK